MTWWQIALIIYGGVNLIIAIYCTILFWREGYYTNWNNGKTKRGWMILVFVILILLGLPIAIFGAVVMTLWG